MYCISFTTNNRRKTSFVCYTRINQYSICKSCVCYPTICYSSVCFSTTTTTNSWCYSSICKCWVNFIHISLLCWNGSSKYLTLKGIYFIIFPTTNKGLWTKYLIIFTTHNWWVITIKCDCWIGIFGKAWTGMCCCYIGSCWPSTTCTRWECKSWISYSGPTSCSTSTSCGNCW